MTSPNTPGFTGTGSGRGQLLGALRADLRRIAERLALLEAATGDEDAMAQLLAARQQQIDQQAAMLTQQITNLSQVAETMAGASEASQTDRAALWQQVHGLAEGLAEVELTPGPAGADGTNGEDGTDGVDGRSVELRATATAIEWRQAGGTWTTLVPLTAITGPAGTAGGIGQLRIATPTVPVLLLGASSDITATWRTPMPSATYAVDWGLPAALVGRATVAVKTQTATGVTLTVTAGLAIPSASALTVVAWA